MNDQTISRGGFSLPNYRVTGLCVFQCGIANTKLFLHRHSGKQVCVDCFKDLLDAFYGNEGGVGDAAFDLLCEYEPELKVTMVKRRD